MTNWGGGGEGPYFEIYKNQTMFIRLGWFKAAILNPDCPVVPKIIFSKALKPEPHFKYSN